MIITLSSIIILFFTLIWILSELVLVKDVRKSNNDYSIWLAINLFLPIVGCIIFKMTHKNQI